ncbi:MULTISPECIES: Na+/H+ antiporter subunit E [unclassified Pusillimonas]|uniref:Na+/H+ antiporter subunit E n=1 Tax=unclassified Pusillimonas TaxID=2640016 RepID=UPI000B9C79E0|nr:MULTISPECIES: Na+/H+ antiporter subunit E [unclassified Pusillimonas]OXR49558.1 Na+/H+ antiporter subunit E [Pusillimonas sp. T2]ROT44329.1 Na+/H+ antiporter subunit E [Pusillimonas sp. NJUB218]
MKRIKRVVNWLMLPTLLLVLWLLLNQTLASSQIVLGAVVSLLLAWAAMRLRPLRSTPKKPLTIIRLFFSVVADITLSNIEVFKIIWFKPQSHTPGFIRIPLDMKDPHGLAALACILTYTPGTVWSGYSDESGVLTLHVLDLEDAQHWIDLVKNRYERPLMEIFE